MNPRRMRLARTSRTGAYNFGGLPPGDYYLVAISEEYANEWQDPRFLQQVSAQATQVSVGEGARATRDLTTQPFRGMSGGVFAPAAVPYDEPDAPLGHGPFVPEVEEPIQQVRQVRQTRDRFDQPTSGSATVSGAVILDNGTGQPLRRVRVSLRSADSSIDRAVMTDDQGRFMLHGLPTGRYSLTATKPAYVTTYFGSRRPGRGPGTPLALTEGQVMENIVMRMPRGAVIAGRVVDEFNQPMQNASIRVMQRRMSAGERRLLSVPGLRNTVRTDDQGRYRVFGLTPGDYVVLVSPATTGQGEVRQLSTSDVDAAVADVRSGAQTTPAAGVSTAGTSQPEAPTVPFGGRAVGFAPVYYPGTLQANAASTVTVRAGQEIQNVDLTVRLVPMARLEGTITGPDGQPVAGVTALLLPEGDQATVGLRSLSSIIRTRPDGTFTASNVAPGRYTLSARSRGSGTETVMELGGGGVFVARQSLPTRTNQADGPPPTPLWAQETVDVNGEDLTGLSLTMHEGMTISGQVVFDGQLPPPEDLGTVRIGVTPVGSNGISLGIPGDMVAADGTFTLAGVTPGSYRMTAAVPSSGGFTADSGWQLGSAVFEGRDTLDTNLEVQPGRSLEGLVLTFTDKRTELSGTVTDSAGDAVSDLTILVFPTDASLWSADSRRMPRPQQPGSDGMFRITSLPPGDYRLAVVTEIEQEQWGDPVFMEQVAAASIPITLVAGEKTVQDVQVGGGER
jgi:protocatechuate 3,4-dioxygenase beta subunit